VISEHVEEFAGLPVRDFVIGEGLTDPAGTAYRLLLEFDDFYRGTTFAALLNNFLADPASGQVVALVIGNWGQIDAHPRRDYWNEGLNWGGEYGDTSAEAVITAVTAVRDRLPSLKALFIGDITYDEDEISWDECKISWIRQANVTPVLTAFPNLEHLRVRGGDGLAVKPLRHEGLKALVIESGGLPAAVVRSVCAAELPNLEHLELWLGSAGYGGDATLEDLAPVLSGTAFPRLKYLGLRDCEWADALAAALADAPVLRRVETLDLSLGNLSDAGAVALLSRRNLSGLKRFDIHHHYVSDGVLDGLKATGVELNAEDRQQPSAYGGVRCIAVSE
jgi:hypothetical protein